ncbi:MAG: ABC transporter ATP-binding protein [Candidatus Omnitrophica bacterium]|nr:ABC transporter ATP-binding protein [Candidatus Omnitrophota bacterium]
MGNILEVKNLHTYFYLDDSVVKAVEGVEFNLSRGEALGLVGESGCGKSMTAYSIVKLIDKPGEIERGEVIFDGKDLLKISGKELSKIRGKDISLIFQEPHAALNPVYSVGFQITETIKVHNKGIKEKEVEERVKNLLIKVGLNPEDKVKSYPHNLSGGEAQRVMIAQSLSCNPKILIADEPTTALDVTVQAKIIKLFKKLQREENFSLIFITHDLALCSQIADRIAVMYSGQLVELASLDKIIKQPQHPYTKALFLSLPQENKRKKELRAIRGDVPEANRKPGGCFFHPRCKVKEERCLKMKPKLKKVSPGHWVRCFKREDRR